MARLKFDALAHYPFCTELQIYTSHIARTARLRVQLTAVFANTDDKAAMLAELARLVEQAEELRADIIAGDLDDYFIRIITREATDE